MNYTLSNVTKDFWDKYYDILGKMITEMTAVTNSDSISQNFINIFAPLCHGAEEMAKNVLRFTQSIAVQKTAEYIVSNQSKTQNILKGIDCECVKNPDRDLRLYTRKANSRICRIFAESENAAVSNSINKSFVRQILPVYKGEYALCENMLMFSVCKELHDFANKNMHTLRHTVRQIKSLSD